MLLDVKRKCTLEASMGHRLQSSEAPALFNHAKGLTRVKPWSAEKRRGRAIGEGWRSCQGEG